VYILPIILYVCFPLATKIKKLVTLHDWKVKPAKLISNFDNDKMETRIATFECGTNTSVHGNTETS